MTKTILLDKLEICPYVLTRNQIIVNIRHRDDHRILHSVKLDYDQRITTYRFKQMIDVATDLARWWIEDNWKESK